jgi:hypothetical protein
MVEKFNHEKLIGILKLNIDKYGERRMSEDFEPNLIAAYIDLYDSPRHNTTEVSELLKGIDAINRLKDFSIPEEGYSEQYDTAYEEVNQFIQALSKRQD